MTDNNRFFKLIWRINGLMIFVVGLCGVLLAVFALSQIFTTITGERNVTGIVNVENAEEIKEELELGYVSKVDNTPYLAIALNSDQKYAQAYFSKVSKSARNYLFINTDTNEKSWLFEHNRFLINQRETLLYKKEGQEKKMPVGYLFQIIKSDTNSDRRITSKDSIVVSLSNLMGEKYKEVLNEIDRVIGHKVSEVGTLSLIYQKHKKAYLMRINLGDFSVIDNEEIEISELDK